MGKIIIGNPEGKSEYTFVHREHPDQIVVVKMNDDERLNDAGRDIEAEDALYAAYPDRRGEFELQSKKLASIVQEDARAQQKLEDVS